MSELIEIADLELRRDGALASAEALGNEFNKILELARSPLTGKTVIAIVSRLVPPLVIKVQEQVIAMESNENAWVLQDVDLAIRGGLHYDVLEEIKNVFEGYGKHIECDFQKVISRLSSDSIKAEDVLRDVARVKQLSVTWDYCHAVQCNEWTDIIPLGHDSGDYLMDNTPLESFRTSLDNFIKGVVCWRGGTAWSLTDQLKGIKDSFHVLDALHKRVLSYLPEVPGE